MRVYWRFLFLFMATFILLLVQKKTRTNKPEVVTADKIDYKMPWLYDKVWRHQWKLVSHSLPICPKPFAFFSIFSVHQILQSIMWTILLTFHVNLIAQGHSGSRRRSYILHTLLSDRGVMTWYSIHFELRTADFQ